MLVELISKKTQESINAIIEKLFNMNSELDNIVYNLENVFHMTQASDIVHHKVAHIFPLWADDIQRHELDRDCRPIRPFVQEHSNLYTNFTDCFNDIQDTMLELEAIIKNSITVSDVNGDVITKIFLEDFYLSKISLFTAQSILWNKKAIDYNEISGLVHFDNDFSNFTIV